jgi:hypothetical protein
MTIQPDGRIIVAGNWAPLSGSNTNSAFGVARLIAGLAPVVVIPKPTVGGGDGGGGGGGDVVVTAPPAFLGAQRLTSGAGRKKKVTGFQLRFSAPLNVAEAQNVAHYAVTQARRGKRSTPKRIPVRSARFNTLDNSVSLVLGKYDAKKPLSLTATGLVGVEGTPAATVVAKL